MGILGVPVQEPASRLYRAVVFWFFGGIVGWTVCIPPVQSSFRLERGGAACW